MPEFDTETIAILEAAGHAFDGKPLAMALELEGWSAPETGDLDWDRDVDPALLGELNDLAYGFEPEVGMARSLVRPPPELALYQARVDGRPACVLATIDHGDDLGVYFVATDPQLRGRGLAREADGGGTGRRAAPRPRDLLASGLGARAAGL